MPCKIDSSLIIKRQLLSTYTMLFSNLMAANSCCENSASLLAYCIIAANTNVQLQGFGFIKMFVNLIDLNF